MATITPRKRADGTTSYRASIRIKRGGQIVHQEAKTFDQKRMAQAWAKGREVELAAPGAIKRAQSGHTIGDLLDWYIKDYVSETQRTKLSALRQLRTLPLAQEKAVSLTSGRLIEHVQSRRAGGTGPATVANDLIWLRVLFKAARPALDMDLNLMVIDDAVAFCRDQKLIARPQRRDRRPTDDELAKLTDYFTARDSYSKVPMLDLMWFAIHSARREAEITRLRWGDNNERHHTGIVRDAKHPTKKEGNHKTFKYTLEGWEIVERQPKTSEFIFPYNSKTISNYFSDACNILEIDDLVFHDLRHEATSRLFEKGHSIVEVQQFTLHESWETLSRYTHLKPKDVQHRP